MAGNWVKIAKVDGNGKLPYSVTGTSTGLETGLKLPLASGGSNEDFSSVQDGVLYKKSGESKLSLLPYETDTSKSWVLNYTPEGVLQWKDSSLLEFTNAGTYLQQGEDATIGTLIVSGEINVLGDGSLNIFNSQEVTATSSTLLLDSDVGTTTPTTGTAGLKIAIGSSEASASKNEPEFYWDYANKEWRMQGFDSTDVQKVAVMLNQSTGSAPADTTGNVGDLMVDTSSNDLYIKTIA